MKNEFYKAFEKKFKDTNESFSEKQEIYMSFIAPIYTYYADGIVLDIKLGDNGWSNFLEQSDIRTQSISLDIDTKQKNDLSPLLKIKDESYSIITAFHIAEYFSQDQLHTLLSEAKRILKPGGILLVETLNPENIYVACEEFYLDPARNKIVPPALLSFMTEYCGFARNKIVRLQNTEYFKIQKYANIAQVIQEVSKDYMIAAQKKAPLEVIQLCDNCFEKDYGPSLVDMLEKFERRMLRIEQFGLKKAKDARNSAKNAFMAVESSMNKVESARMAAESARMAAESARMAAENSLDNAENARMAAESANLKVESLRIEAKQAYESARLSAEHAANMQTQYLSAINSFSWKITKPLRLIKSYTKRVIRAILFRTSKAYSTRMVQNTHNEATENQEGSRLSPKTKKIYDELQKNINKSENETKQ